MSAFFHEALSCFRSIVNAVGILPLLENVTAAVASGNATNARCNGLGALRTAPPTAARSMTYADALARIHIVADGGIACAGIRTGGAGTLILRYANGSTDTITTLAGETLWVKATAIEAGSTATAITVFWDE
jgi:hypothetical protein